MKYKIREQCLRLNHLIETLFCDSEPNKFKPIDTKLKQVFVDLKVITLVICEPIYVENTILKLTPEVTKFDYKFFRENTKEIYKLIPELISNINNLEFRNFTENTLENEEFKEYCKDLIFLFEQLNSLKHPVHNVGENFKPIIKNKTNNYKRIK